MGNRVHTGEGKGEGATEVTQFTGYSESNMNIRVGLGIITPMLKSTHDDYIQAHSCETVITTIDDHTSK